MGLSAVQNVYSLTRPFLDSKLVRKQFVLDNSSGVTELWLSSIKGKVLLLDLESCPPPNLGLAKRTADNQWVPSFASQLRCVFWAPSISTSIQSALTPHQTQGIPSLLRRRFSRPLSSKLLKKAQKKWCHVGHLYSQSFQKKVS